MCVCAYDQALFEKLWMISVNFGQKFALLQRPSSGSRTGSDIVSNDTCQHHRALSIFTRSCLQRTKHFCVLSSKFTCYFGYEIDVVQLLSQCVINVNISPEFVVTVSK